MSPKESSVHRRARIIVALAVALGAVFVVPRNAAHITPTLLNATTVAVNPGAGQAPGMYEASGTLVVPGGQPVRLAATPSAPLTGWISPVLVPAADHRTVVYSAWRQARTDDPSQSWSSQGIQPGDALGTSDIRRVDLITGTDTLLESGAIAPMFSGDGKLAYVRGVTPSLTAGSDYNGTVMVRPTIDGTPVAWTTTAKRYAIAAWAGARLLAYEIGEGESLSLVALDGPGQSHSLGAGTLVAVSPDGSEVLTEQTDSAPMQVSLINVYDGSVLSVLPLDQGVAATYGIDALSYSGAWTADTVAARAGIGLVLFKVTDDTVTLSDVLRFDATSFPTGVIQPRFAKTDGSEITAWGSQIDATGTTRTVEVDCQLAAHACTSFPMIDAAAQPAFNPSAPFAG